MGIQVPVCSGVMCMWNPCLVGANKSLVSRACSPTPSGRTSSTEAMISRPPMCCSPMVCWILGIIFLSIKTTRTVPFKPPPTKPDEDEEDDYEDEDDEE